MSLIVFVIVGLLGALIARAILPSSQQLSVGATATVGVFGALLGGIFSALFNTRTSWLDVHAVNLVYAALGAVVVLALVSVSGHWTRTQT